MKRNKRGFTLVEMLLVIAIISIISGVAIVNLNSARNKSKMAAIKTQLNSIIPLVQLCYSFDDPLLYNGEFICNGEEKIKESRIVCSSVTDEWPILENGYTYGTCDGDVDDFYFTFSADPPEGSSGLKRISCGDDTLGCQEEEE